MAKLYFDILIEKCKNFDDIDVKSIILVDHFVRHGKTVILSYWMSFLRENSIFNAIFSIFQKDAILGVFLWWGDVNIYLYIYIFAYYRIPFCLGGQDASFVLCLTFFTSKLALLWIFFDFFRFFRFSQNVHPVHRGGLKNRHVFRKILILPVLFYRIYA